MLLISGAVVVMVGVRGLVEFIAGLLPGPCVGWNPAPSTYEGNPCAVHGTRDDPRSAVGRSTVQRLTSGGGCGGHDGSPRRALRLQQGLDREPQVALLAARSRVGHLQRAAGGAPPVVRQAAVAAIADVARE